MKVYAVIPSGGIGKRINALLPKQYIKFNNKEIIVYTLENFQSLDLIDEIIIASQPEFIPLLEEIKKAFSFNKISKIVEGGSERQLSVFNAVKSIAPSEDDLILVHDAVRPLTPKSVLENAILTAKEFGASVVAVRAKDTLIKGNDLVDNYVDRSEIWYAQTPQTFRYKIFKHAMLKAESENFLGTDESMLVKRAGFDVKIVEGSSLNFKITTDDDLKIFGKIFEDIGSKSF